MRKPIKDSGKPYTGKTTIGQPVETIEQRYERLLSQLFAYIQQKNPAKFSALVAAAYGYPPMTKEQAREAYHELIDCFLDETGF